MNEKRRILVILGSLIAVFGGLSAVVSNNLLSKSLLITAMVLVVVTIVMAINLRKNTA